ncbi:MAG: lytic transglycosylase domain-containing protein [Rhodobacteraceae bacterium]|nr:lytic transglycosylase domain-containing protein [Paracoccaceae bacterium]
MSLRALMLSVAAAAALTLPAGPAAADLRAALRAAAAGDWEAARAEVRGEGPVAADIVEWHRLRAGDGTWAEYRDFLARRPDWPGLALLAQEGERKIPAGADPEAVIAYFAGRPPETGAGLLRLAEAYAARGLLGDAEASLVQGWRTLLLRAEDQAALLAAHGELLRPHHEARLDMLLWRGAELNARAMLPLVSEGWRKLALARIGLRAQADGVDGLIAAVPQALKDDPGLAFERFQWRARKGRNAEAAALALERSVSAEALGRPEAWASWRLVLARAALREGRPREAYRLAARHRLTEGADYAELEWFAGYVALRALGDPETALRHFRAFRVAVETPISLGRAGYWEGRALEALGDAEGARAAYEFGGEHQTSFYGLLAAEKAGLPMDATLASGGRAFPDWRGAAFARSSVFEAAQLIRAAGDRLLFTRFLLHLAEPFDTTAYGQLTDWALSVGEHYTAVALAKQAAQRNIILPRAYFPVTGLAETDFGVPPELVLAIARRESEFNPEVVSSAGARGLMQVMPGTAEDMAKALGIPFSRERLTADPAYNARLGAAYLRELIGRFGPNPVLVAAAYNAGPSRPVRWIEEQGDPRSAGTDVIDWIEAIPFAETRSYVMRVTESLPIYRARLSGRTAPIRFSEELRAR